MPLLPTPVPHLTAIQRMPLTGPLGYVRDIYEKDLRHRLQAGHLSSALALCSEILGDIEAMVDAANG